MKLKEEEKLYKELLEPVLGKYGFIPHGKNYYMAERNFGNDILGYDLNKDSGLRVFSYVFRRRYNRVEELLEPYYDLLNIQPDLKHSTLVVNKTLLDPKVYHEFGSNQAGYSYPLTEEGIQGFVIKFSEDLNTSIFPVLKKYEDIAELDKLANQPPSRFRELWNIFNRTGLILKKMIIARVAGNQDYNKVADAVKTIIESWKNENPDNHKKYLVAFEKLDAELRSVSPIT